MLGASGATGRQTVAVASRRRHEVVAVVRRAGSLHGVTEAVWDDLSDRETLASVFEGADAVISALGGAAKGPTSVCTDAMSSVVPAMQTAGVSRLVVVSAHGVLESHDRSLYSRAVWAGVGERGKDKESMEELITPSPLRWTIVRPPALKDTPATGKYRVGENLPIRLWDAIGRADLAAFLVQEAESPTFVRGYPRIRR